MCDSMSEYELAGTVSQPINETTWHWVKPKQGQASNPQSQKLDKQQLKRQQRQLQNYCAQLIDKYEDDISAALQRGSNAAGECPVQLWYAWTLNYHRSPEHFPCMHSQPHGPTANVKPCVKQQTNSTCAYDSYSTGAHSAVSSTAGM